jgi:hypothetical protein
VTTRFWISLLAAGASLTARADWLALTRPPDGVRAAAPPGAVPFSPRDVRLAPFHRLHERCYTVYFDIFTEAQWQQRQAEVQAERERQAALEARTVDRVRIGELQSERDHHLTGERTSAGEAYGRKWRHATDGGWFAFDLQARPGQPHELRVTYWGGDAGNRVFDILVNGEKIATQRLNQNAPGKFFDETYSIPARLTEGRSELTVRFQAHPGAMAGGVFGVALLQPEQ